MKNGSRPSLTLNLGEFHISVFPGSAWSLAAGPVSFLARHYMALNLAQLVAEKTKALCLLEEAYESQFGIDGSQSVVLDSILETARAKGFYGSLELAAGVLRVSGRFLVEREPAGKWMAVRQSTALVPVDVGPTSMAAVDRLKTADEGPAG